MKQLFDQISVKSSKLVTNTYSTSFSLGIKFLDKSIRTPIYNIYGFVRFADEIVDSFHGFDKANLLQKFRLDTIEAIDQGISLNPILNSFQETVNQYGIEWDLIETFFFLLLINKFLSISLSLSVAGYSLLYESKQ